MDAVWLLLDPFLVFFGRGLLLPCRVLVVFLRLSGGS